MVTSASHLEIPLMTAERAWAYGMQRKQETADAPYRVRRHVVTRLAKAAKVRLEKQDGVHLFYPQQALPQRQGLVGGPRTLLGKSSSRRPEAVMSSNGCPNRG